MGDRIPVWYYPIFLQNFWMATHGVFGSPVLGVTWSLAVEEQFYLTLPLIVRYVHRSRLWWIVGAMIVGAPLLRIVLSHTIAHGTFAGYVLMPCRADALGCGIAAALVDRTPAIGKMILRHRSYLYLAFCGVGATIAVLLLSRFKPFTASVFSLEYSLLAIFYVLLLMVVLTSRKVGALFSLSGLRYMGTIAYGLYLLHCPFIAAGHDIGFRLHPKQSGWLSLLLSVAAIALATVVAAISWEYLEKPFIKRGHRYGYSKKSLSRELFLHPIPFSSPSE